MFCPKCGNRISDDAAFCGTCGAPVGARGQAASAGTPPSAMPKKKKPLKLIAAAAIAAVAIAGVAFAAVALQPPSMNGTWTASVGISTQGVDNELVVTMKVDGENTELSFDTENFGGKLFGMGNPELQILNSLKSAGIIKCKQEVVDDALVCGLFMDESSLDDTKVRKVLEDLFSSGLISGGVDLSDADESDIASLTAEVQEELSQMCDTFNGCDVKLHIPLGYLKGGLPVGTWALSFDASGMGAGSGQGTFSAELIPTGNNADSGSVDLSVSSSEEEETLSNFAEWAYDSKKGVEVSFEQYGTEISVSVNHVR